MSRLVVDVPESLRSQLEERARAEHTPVEQYVLYLLTRELTLAYSVEPVPEAEAGHQKADYSVLLQRLGHASFREIETVLDAREEVSPEEGLSPRAVEALRRRLLERQPGEEG